jgi:hypothetical protein
LRGQHLRAGEHGAHAAQRGVGGVELVGGTLRPVLDGGGLRLVELVPDQQASRLRVITRRLHAQTARQFALGFATLASAALARSMVCW